MGSERTGVIGDTSRYRRFTFLVVLAMAVPGVWTQLQNERSAWPRAPFFAYTAYPRGFDSFLASANSRLPKGEPVLVTGAPLTLVHIGAAYDLYPHRVLSVPRDDGVPVQAPRVTWAQLEREAVREHAHYVLLWNLRVDLPAAHVVVRSRRGELLRITT